METEFVCTAICWHLSKHDQNWTFGLKSVVFNKMFVYIKYLRLTITFRRIEIFQIMCNIALMIE